MRYHARRPGIFPGVFITPNQTFTGLAEIRPFFQEELASKPEDVVAAFTLTHQDIQGEVAYIVWKMEPFIKMGTDTFLIRDGKIIAQTFASA